MTKKISRLLCIAAVMTMFCTTAFGASIENLAKAAIGSESLVSADILKRSDLADKTRADMKAKFKASKEKWDSLNDAQKEEIFRLKDISIDIECQIVDKYIEFGIIDAETGNEIKSKKHEFKSEMRKSGKMPGHGIKHNGGKHK